MSLLPRDLGVGAFSPSSLSTVAIACGRNEDDFGREDVARGFAIEGSCVTEVCGCRGLLGEKETRFKASESLGRGDIGVFGREELEALLGERSPEAGIGAWPV